MKVILKGYKEVKEEIEVPDFFYPVLDPTKCSVEMWQAFGDVTTKLAEKLGFAFPETVEVDDENGKLIM